MKAQLGFQGDSLPKKRNYGLDVLRIILMLMIVMHHSIVHGLGLRGLEKGTEVALSFPYYLMNGFCIVGVNCFFWISGFCGIQFRLRKNLELYLKCVFYVAVLMIALTLTGVVPAYGTAKELIKKIIFIVVPVKDYWFIWVYFALTVVAPLFNRGIENTSTKEDWIIFAGLVAINTLYGFVGNFVGVGLGYTVMQGIYMYLIGRLCSKYYDRLSSVFKNGYLYTYLLAAVLVSAMAFVLAQRGMYKISWRMYAYNNPLVVLAAVSLGMFFSMIKAEGNFARKLAKGSANCLAVYLLTDYSKMRKIVFKPLQWVASNNTTLITLPTLVLYAIILVIICILLDAMRAALVKRVFPALNKK